MFVRANRLPVFIRSYSLMAVRNVDGDMEMYAVRGTVGPDHSQGTVDSNTFTNMVCMFRNNTWETHLKLDCEDGIEGSM